MPGSDPIRRMPRVRICCSPSRFDPNARKRCLDCGTELAKPKHHTAYGPSLIDVMQQCPACYYRNVDRPLWGRD